MDKTKFLGYGAAVFSVCVCVCVREREGDVRESEMEGGDGRLHHHRRRRRRPLTAHLSTPCLHTTHGRASPPCSSP
jgi:hypothetical protein